MVRPIDFERRIRVAELSGAIRRMIAVPMSLGEIMEAARMAAAMADADGMIKHNAKKLPQGIVIQMHPAVAASKAPMV